MTLAAYSLASGSSGNSMLVRCGRTSVLIDAGIGIKRLIAALQNIEVDPAGISAILITHEHGDHIISAVRMANRFRIPLVANAPTLKQIKGSGNVPVRELEVGEEAVFGSLSVRSFRVCHDAACPVGYSIRNRNGVVCYATDTGRLTQQICTEAVAADLLILESNHDVEMVVHGHYPAFLKRRILGERGHLSNDAAAKLISYLAAQGKPKSVWLAHLSNENNTPAHALTTAQRALANYPGNSLKISVAQRDVPSLSWQRGGNIFQMSLFGSAVD